MVRRSAVGVPADIAVLVTAPVPPIRHLGLAGQQNVILRNAEVAMMGGEEIALITQHEYDMLSSFLVEILLDSDRTASHGGTPFWDRAYYATCLGTSGE